MFETVIKKIFLIYFIYYYNNCSFTVLKINEIKKEESLKIKTILFYHLKNYSLILAKEIAKVVVVGTVKLYLGSDE